MLCLKLVVFHLSHPQTLRPPCPCWSSTSSWAWWLAVWWPAGAAGRLAGSFGVSASAVSCLAATSPARPASSVLRAVCTARSTDWQKSRHTHRSTGRNGTLQGRLQTPTVQRKMSPWQLFRGDPVCLVDQFLHRDVGLTRWDWAVVRGEHEQLMKQKLLFGYSRTIFAVL